MAERRPHQIRLIEDQWASFRHVVEAVAIVAAGLWAFYTFVYQEKIKPAGEPPAINDSISVQRLGRDGRRDVLEVTISYHNVGRAEVDLAADAFNVWGERFGTRDVVKRLDGGNHAAFNRTVPLVSDHVITWFAELRDAAAGGRKGFHTIIEPGDTETVGEVIVVPRGEYDAVHAQVIAVPVRLSPSGSHRIDIVHNRDGSIWLRTNEPADFENDNESDFSLIP
jgi:hypothetical protein